SGSLITARLASEMGREVFAIPGSIHSPLSRGCHALIRQGAKLVESAQDIDDELGQPDAGPAPAAASMPSPPEPALKAAPQDAVGRSILEAIGFDPIDLETLQRRTQLALPMLNSALLDLELADLVARQDDGRFSRR